MAILGRKKTVAAKTDKAEAKKEVKAVAVVSATPSFDPGSIVVRPRITEKASFVAEKGFYTFEVTQKADKASVARAIKAIYNVTPVSVNIVKIPSKKVFSRGRAGVKKGGRKAYVELKKGDKIEFV